MAGSSISRHAGGCVSGLALFAALAWVDYRLLAPVSEPRLRVGLTAAAALCLALGLMSFWNLARGFGRGERSREAMIERAVTGVPPEDGQAMIATGHVRSLGEPFLAPLSGIPCVSYQYRMYYEVHGGKRKRVVPVYWGYASRGFAIDSPGSRVSVLAVPLLSLAAETRTGADSIERGRRLIGTTRWEPVAPLATAGTVFEMARTVFTDEDGTAGRDWKRDGDERDPAELLLEETLLPVAAVASVCGTWSAERGAIVAQASAEGGVGVTVVLGPPEGLLAAANLGSFGSYLAFATLATALGVGIIWFAVRVLPTLP